MDGVLGDHVPSVSGCEELCEAAGINRGGPHLSPPRINGVLLTPGLLPPPLPTPPPKGGYSVVGLSSVGSIALWLNMAKHHLGWGGLREGPPNPPWVEGQNGMGGLGGGWGVPCPSLPQFAPPSCVWLRPIGPY